MGWFERTRPTVFKDTSTILLNLPSNDFFSSLSASPSPSNGDSFAAMRRCPSIIEVSNTVSNILRNEVNISLKNEFVIVPASNGVLPYTTNRHTDLRQYITHVASACNL